MSKVVMLVWSQGHYSTYDGMKVNRVAMCKVRSKEKITKNKNKK
jgi:hypothetical protein